LALVLMLVGLLLISLLLFYVLGASISRLTGRLSYYASQLNGRVTNLQDLLDITGLSGVAGFLSNLFLILMIMLFLLSGGPAMMDRLRSGVSGDSIQLERLGFVGRGVVRQFGLRALVNFVTAAGITVLLFVLGVDFALLWGVLSFFLSFVPYIGLVLAATPAVLLALAEFGFGRAIFLIAGVTVVNILAENVLTPVLMGRGLSLSPTVVFISFVFWAWMLGGPGAFLALPITLFVAVMLETFPETRWVARLMGMPDVQPDPPTGGGEDAAAPG
jgi:AI-2 transport protein TqsA